MVITEKEYNRNKTIISELTIMCMEYEKYHDARKVCKNESVSELVEIIIKRRDNRIKSNKTCDRKYIGHIYSIELGKMKLAGLIEKDTERELMHVFTYILERICNNEEDVLF